MILNFIPKIYEKIKLFFLLFSKYQFGINIYTNKEISEYIPPFISNIEKINYYLKYIIDKEDYISLIIVDDDFINYTTLDIYKEKNQYHIKYLKQFPELFLEINEKNISHLFSSNNTFLNIIKNPNKFGFYAKKGFTLSCRYNHSIELKDMKNLILCIDSMTDINDEIDIYDEATGTKFTIWFDDNRYIFEMFMGDICFIEMNKEELIKFIGNDIDIFNQMQNRKENFGFEFK